MSFNIPSNFKPIANPDSHEPSKPKGGEGPSGGMQGKVVRSLAKKDSSLNCAAFWKKIDKLGESVNELIDDIKSSISSTWAAEIGIRRSTKELNRLHNQILHYQAKPEPNAVQESRLVLKAIHKVKAICTDLKSKVKDTFFIKSFDNLIEGAEYLERSFGKKAGVLHPNLKPALADAPDKAKVSTPLKKASLKKPPLKSPNTKLAPIAEGEEPPVVSTKPGRDKAVEKNSPKVVAEETDPFWLGLEAAAKGDDSALKSVDERLAADRKRVERRLPIEAFNKQMNKLMAQAHIKQRERAGQMVDRQLKQYSAFLNSWKDKPVHRLNARSLSECLKVIQKGLQEIPINYADMKWVNAIKKQYSVLLKRTQADQVDVLKPEELGKLSQYELQSVAGSLFQSIVAGARGDFPKEAKEQLKGIMGSFKRNDMNKDAHYFSPEFFLLSNLKFPDEMSNALETVLGIYKNFKRDVPAVQQKHIDHLSALLAEIKKRQLDLDLNPEILREFTPFALLKGADSLIQVIISGAQEALPDKFKGSLEAIKRSQKMSSLKELNSAVVKVLDIYARAKHEISPIQQKHIDHFNNLMNELEKRFVDFQFKEFRDAFPVLHRGNINRAKKVLSELADDIQWRAEDEKEKGFPEDSRFDAWQNELKELKAHVKGRSKDINHLSQEQLKGLGIQDLSFISWDLFFDIADNAKKHVKLDKGVEETYKALTLEKLASEGISATELANFKQLASAFKRTSSYFSNELASHKAAWDHSKNFFEAEGVASFKKLNDPVTVAQTLSKGLDAVVSSFGKKELPAALKEDIKHLRKYLAVLYVA